MENSEFTEPIAESTTAVPTGRLGWVVGSTAFLALFSLLYLGDLVCSGLYFARVQSSISEKLRHSTNTFVLVTDSEISEFLPTKDVRVQRIADMVTLIEKDDFQKALGRLRHPAFPTVANLEVIEDGLEEAIGLQKEADSWSKTIQFVGPMPSGTPAPIYSSNENPLTRLASLKQKLLSSRYDLLTPYFEFDVSGGSKAAYTQFRELVADWGYDLPSFQMGHA